MRPLKTICTLFFLALAWCEPVWASGAYGPGPYLENLLVNPNGDFGDLRGWTIISNGGNGWTVQTDPYPHASEDNGFLTSYDWAKREQVVSLMALGFTAEYLDTQPAIIVAEQFEKVFCADYFFLEVELLGSSGNILHSWSTGQLQHAENICDYSGYKEKISHKLTGYGTGVRFIRWRDGGKDSEWWQGHFGPKLQNAYLALMPANLLKRPEELSSWILAPGSNFNLTGPPNLRQFRTSFDWSERRQVVDLLDLGISAEQLDSGELPILAEGTYREMACPDEFYLRVELLDTNHQVLATRDSGIKMHNGECDWTYSLYGETIHHRFDNYPAGVRYLRWEDGGKDREYWAGHFGAILEAPYIGIVNNANWKHGAGRILEAWDYGLVSEADDGATYRAPAVQRMLSEMPAQRTDPQMTLCDAACKMQRIREDVANDDSSVRGSLWELGSANSVEIFSSPRKGECPNTAQHLSDCHLKTSGEELLASIKTAIRNGRHQIDITTLDGISSEWAVAIRDALKEVEQRAVRESLAPIVRVHIGISGGPTWSSNWEQVLSPILADLTRGLAGNSSMSIFISGARRTGFLAPTSWNHSKIVAVDGGEAFVGGHNLWSDYLKDDPVFDTSMKLTGESAMSSHEFVSDLVWDHMLHNSEGAIVRNAFQWFRGSTTHPFMIPIVTPSISPGPGPIQVMAVGQLATDAPNPLKTAVLSTLGTAEKSIYLSQQMLTHYYYHQWQSAGRDQVDHDIAALLVRKALVEGVRVNIIMSNRDGIWGSSADNDTLVRELWQASGRGSVEDIASQTKFCKNFSVAYLRINDVHRRFPPRLGHEHEPTAGFTNHSKTLMVDKQVFLIGSHNLYAQTPAQHAEFVYIVANAQEADKFNRSYWEPILAYSSDATLDEKACNSAITPPPVIRLWDGT